MEHLENQCPMADIVDIFSPMGQMNIEQMSYMVGLCSHYDNEQSHGTY